LLITDGQAGMSQPTKNWRLVAAPAGAAICGLLSIVLGILGNNRGGVVIGIGLIVVTALLLPVGRLTGRL
jgi:hypothetical protein